MSHLAFSLVQQETSSGEEDDLFSGLKVKAARSSLNEVNAASPPTSPKRWGARTQRQSFASSVAALPYGGTKDDQSSIVESSGDTASDGPHQGRFSAFDFIQDTPSRQRPSSLNELEGLRFEQFSQGVPAFAVPSNGLPSSRHSPTPRDALSLTGSPRQSLRVKASLTELGIDDIPPSAFSSVKAPPILEGKIAETERKLADADKELQQIVEHQMKIFQKRHKIHEILIEKLQELKSVENSQSTALANEDFAHADVLAHRIQDLHKSINRRQLALPALEQTLNELREKHVNLLKWQADARKILQEEYRIKKVKEEEGLKQFNADMENLKEVQTGEIKTACEEIEKERSEIVFYMDLWEKNEAELNDKIDELVRDQKADRGSLVTKQTELNHQIAELLEKIEGLRAEEAACVRQIEAIDHGIEELANQFSAERDELRREKEELDKREEDVENKLRAVNENESQLQQQLDHHKQKQEFFEAGLKTLETRISEMSGSAVLDHEAALEIEKLIAHLRDRTFTDRDTEITNARVKTTEYDEHVKRLTARVMQDQQMLSSIQQDIATIDTQLPALEEQKKLAVAGRDFRAAGRLASRTKELQSTLDDRTRLLQAKSESLKQDREALELARRRLEEQTQKLEELEKQIGTELCDELQETLLHLRSRCDVASQKNFRTLQELLQKETECLEQRLAYSKLRYGFAESSIPFERKAVDASSGPDLSKYEETVAEAQTKLSLLEERLEQAVAAEDFELAEKIEQEIQQMRRASS